MTEREGSDQPAQLHALVRGRVQGVFFRDFTIGHARGLGLAGWVRNRPDGAVEVLAHGDRPSLERLIGRLREGPPGAFVSEVEAVWDAPTERFDSFEVRG